MISPTHHVSALSSLLIFTIPHICAILRRYNTFFVRRREYRNRADVLRTLHPACVDILCRFLLISVLLNYNIFHGLASAPVILL